MISETYHSTPRARPPERRRIALRVAIAVGAFVVLALLLAVPSVISGALDAFGGRRSLEAAAAAVKAEDADAAQRALADAETQLGGSASSLGSIWTLPARATPVIGRQLRTARAIATSGAIAARAGMASVEVLRERPDGGWGLEGGAIDAQNLRRAGEILRAAVPLADQAQQEIEQAPRGWLMPPLGGFRDEAEKQIVGAVGGIRKAAVGLLAAPELLGGNGRRRYLVMNSNRTELRGTGGFLGYYAMLDAEQGRLSLGESGRPALQFPSLRRSGVRFSEAYVNAWDRIGGAHNWRSVNVSPDFPTVGDIAVQALSQPPGPIDGMLQIDPDGIAALLRITGPVAVQGWPGPISADNVARVSEYEAYIRFGNDSVQRDAFGDRILRAVFAKALSPGTRLGIAAMEPLGKAVAEGHIRMYSKNREGQQALEQLDMDGGLKRTEGATDVLSVFNQNGSANKIDWFLRRDIDYEVNVDPNTGSAKTRLLVTLRNDAPTSGLPTYIIGPNDEGISAGENQTIIGILRPRGARLQRLVVNGKPTVSFQDPEHHLDVYQLYVSIPSHGQARIEADFDVPDIVRDGTIDLRTVHQPLVNPGRFAVRVDAPWGWHADGAYEGTVTSDLEMKIRVNRTFFGKLTAPVEAIGRAVLRLF